MVTLNDNLIFQIEALLIFIGMIGLILNIPTSKYLLSIALGLQNGSTSYYGKSIIRTTHMTGTMTDLGIMLAHKFIKKHDIPFWRINIYLCLLLGFFIGSILGVMAFHIFSYTALTISCLICLAMVKFNFIKTPNNNN